MSSNVNISLNPHENKIILTNISSIEIIILYLIGISGILINLLTMIYLLIIAAYKMKSSCFLFHHCFICLILSILSLPYILSFSNYSIGCHYLGNIQVTCVTAQLLNMAAMVANEAYTFEDLIHQDLYSNHSHLNSNSNSYQYQFKQSNQSTISCGCLSFGILIIWFSSIILHLGITMIGSESKSYYDNDGKYCNFIIRDHRGYVLTLMWIIITIFSLMITIRYIHKILTEVSSKRRHNQPLLSLSIIGKHHGQTIATRDIIMQQIQLRIKLNILLIILFIIFWFPLFIVTLCNIKFNDMKFKIRQQILRYLLLLAWSNSSISPLTYYLLLSKCNYLSIFFCKKDRRTTYDSLTTYYNRIGDRFHDIGISNQYDKQDKQDKQDKHDKQNKEDKNLFKKKSNRMNFIENNQINNSIEDLNEKKVRLKNLKENNYKLNDFSNLNSSSSDKFNSKTNSIFVKEISNNIDKTSSFDSLTTINYKQDQPFNGLIVTSSKHVHL